MSDLISRLLEAIEAKEQKARASTVQSWTARGLYLPLKGCRCLSCEEDDPWSWTIQELDGPDNEECFYPIHIGEADAKHIADNDPSSVLRRCKADKLIVDQYRLFERSGSDDVADAMRDVVKHLALSYGITEEEK